MSTFEQVGNSLGIAILSAILAVALTQDTIGLVKESQLLPTNVRSEIIANIEDDNQVEIVDNITVYQAAQSKNNPEDVNREIVTIYLTTLAVGFICLVGYLLSGNLPRKTLTELTTGGEIPIG